MKIAALVDYSEQESIVDNGINQSKMIQDLYFLYTVILDRTIVCKVWLNGKHCKLISVPGLLKYNMHLLPYCRSQ